jgi:hypothetical protein
MSFEYDTAVEPAVRSEDKRVEVAVEGDTAVIRLSSYAEGIGWFVQKTIKVDADMVDSLIDQLCSARSTIKSESDDILSADLLEF